MTSKNNRPFNRLIRAILGLLLAWIVPGAGHAFVGRPGRGIVIFIAIGATFWGGIAMGGVMTVDHQGQKWWFAAEMLTGVHGLVGWQRESRQLEKLDPEIRAGMARDGADLQDRAANRRLELTECNRQIVQLEHSIAAATAPQERKILKEDYHRRMDDKATIENDLIGYHEKLMSLRSGYIEKVLAEENLALVAPMATVARAYAGVAGLLNLMCMFDVIMLALIGTVATTAPSNREDDRQ